MPWERDPHTAAKHELLKRYLQAWFPILLQRFPRVTYADAFAGPGVYTKGEPGSPIIALDVITEQAALLEAGARQARFVFLDADPGHVADLTRELERRHPAGRRLRGVVVVGPQVGRCETDLLSALNGAGVWGAPLFALLDSFGGPDVPLAVVRRIAQNPSSEVMVTFGPAFYIRFGNAHDPSEMDEVFGSPQWRAALDAPSDQKKAQLVATYRKALHRIGFAYTLTFEMLDEGGRALFLVFATTSVRGLEKMKEAMWKVDPVHGVRYRDPADPDQQQLDITLDPDTGLLRRQLLARLADRQHHRVAELRHYALLETVYRAEHVLPVLRALRDGGRLLPDHGRLTTDTEVWLC